MRSILFVLAIVFFAGCTTLTPLQRSKFLTVSHLIETAKYNDAKQLVEEMIEDEEMVSWSRTWYLRGVLAQDAYRSGMAANDRRRFELYPNQLYVVYESFEKAIELEGRGRMESQLKPRYVLMANDFQRLGERKFNGGDYAEALKAFEQAMEITLKPYLSLQLDTSLIYNAGMSAFQASLYDQAVQHFGVLHKNAFSTNVTHLLYKSKLAIGENHEAEQVLLEGIDQYDDKQELVLLLVDYLAENGQFDRALEILDAVANSDPGNASYHFTTGLIYQRLEEYNKAILAYFDANEHRPDDPLTHVNIATCYYNIGVEIEEESRTLTSIQAVNEKRAQSEAAFEAAIIWLDKANALNPDDQLVSGRIFDLYRQLRLHDRVRM